MKTYLVLTLEVSALIACIALGNASIVVAGGNFDGWIMLAGTVFVATELFRRYERSVFKTESPNLSPGELVRHRESLRQILQEEIYRCRHEKLRKDVVIRHVNRVDQYPEASAPKKGISPWFRVGLVDTYEKGIVVGLRYTGLIKTEDGYRGVDYARKEESDLTVLLAATIPYDYIETVNIDGDKYYPYPHIYCYFWNKGEPYERVYFCVEEPMEHGHPYYREIAAYEDVKRNTDDAGIKASFW